MRKPTTKAAGECPGRWQCGNLLYSCQLLPGHPGPHLYESDDNAWWYRIEWETE